MRTRRGLALVAALALAAGACGDDGSDGSDGGDSDTGAGEVTTTGATGDGDTGDGAGGDGATDGTCAGTDLEFTNLTTGESVEVTDTAAVSLADGAAYTTYLADFAIDPAELTSFSSPTVPDDGNMITVFLTVFNAEEVPDPVEAGTEVPYSSEFGVLTFTLVHQAGAEQFGTNTGAAGTLTVTAVGDTFCAEVQYADAEKSLSGTIEAEVTAV